MSKKSKILTNGEASYLNQFGRRSFLRATATLAATAPASIMLNSCSTDFESPVVSQPTGNLTSRSFIISGGTVLPMDAKRNCYSNGAVAVVDGTIKAVGPAEEVRQKYPELTLVDASGKLVMPGFVDSHIHDWYWGREWRLGKKKFDFNSEHKYSSWSHGGDYHAVGEYGDKLQKAVNTFVSDEERYACSLLMCLDLIKSGTTCGIDVGSGSASPLAQAYVDIGMRGSVSELIADIKPLEDFSGFDRFKDMDDMMVKLEDSFQKWHEKDPKIRVIGNVIVGLFGSDELWTDMVRFCRENNTKVSSHIAALASEDEASKALFGKTVLDRMDDLGVLNEHLLGCHLAYIGEKDIPRIVNSGCGCNYASMASVQIGVDYPVTNIHPKLWKAGAKVAVATDGGFAQPTTMLGAARAALNHNMVALDENYVSKYKALELATIDAARVAGWDDKIGSLEPGKRADIVLHDVSDERYDGVSGNSLLYVFLYRANRADVHTVFIDGEMVLQNGHATRVDEEKLRNNSLSAMRSIGKRIDAVESVMSLIS